MATQTPYLPAGLPATVAAGIVQNVATTQASDNSVVGNSAGRSGELYVTEVHGKRYASATRGNMYWGSSGTGGVSLLAAGGTTAGFVLYNSDANKYLEVHKLRFAAATTVTDVIAGLGIEGSKQVPSGTLTGTLTTQFPLSLIGVAAASSPASGKVYGAATITAMTFLGPLGINVTATTFGPNTAEVDFDGTLVLGPGYAVNVVSSITQGANIMWAGWVWSEWLP